MPRIKIFFWRLANRRRPSYLFGALFVKYQIKKNNPNRDANSIQKYVQLPSVSALMPKIK
jgi:hypothetical protein